MKATFLGVALIAGVLCSSEDLSPGAVVPASLSGATVQAETSSPKDSPNQALHLNNRGIAHLEKYEYRLAAEQFQQAVSLEQDFLAARINLGIALYYDNKYPAAREVLQEVLKSNPDEPHAHFVLGLIAGKENKPLEAREQFEQVLAGHPQDPATNYNLGITALRSRNYAQAIQYFQHVLSVEPEHVAALYNLSQALFLSGRREEGQQLVAKLRELRGTEQIGGPTGSIGSQYNEEGRFAVAMTDYPPSTGSPEKIPVRFADVTANAGIGFVHAGPAAKIAAAALSRELRASEYSKEWAEENLVPAYGSGAAFLDYNLDGHPDIFLVNCGPESSHAHHVLYRNNSNGTFTDVTEEAGLASTGLGMGVAVGDYDNDGYPDLYITNYGHNLLFHNEKNGKFRDVTAEAGVGGNDGKWSLSAVFFDYDHDGDLDLFVTNFVDLGHPPQKEVFRFPDDFGGQPNMLLRNNGNGTFTDVTDQAKVAGGSEKSTGVFFTDYNERRDIDFLVTNFDSASRLFSNNRDGTFAEVASKAFASGAGAFLAAASAYLDRSGFPDFFFPATGADRAGWLLKNQGGSSFAPVALLPAGFRSTQVGGRIARTATFLDYDNDGYQDILEAADRCFLLRNQGNGQFADVSDDTGLAGLPALSPRSIALGDYDGDGDVDVLITNCGGRPLLLRNDGGNLNHYLKLNLAGLQDNKQGIGSKVEIRSGAMWQKMEVDGHPSYLSQSDPEIIFGLGKQTVVDSITILWPGGVFQAETSPATDTNTRIHQVDRKGTSCPLLYTWDGSGFRFVTDFLGGSAMGSLEEPGKYNETDTDEYILVGSRQLKSREGHYLLKMNNQLEEVMFIDQAELLAIDHPADVGVFPNERLMPGPPFPEFRVYQSKGAKPLVRATNDRGDDILPAIHDIDRKYPSDFRLLPFKGYAEKHSMILDLGDLSSAPKVLLLMNAWIDYADSTSNLAASQAGLHLTPPYLQVPNERGEWVTVLENMGFPAGLPKTMTVDLTGKFLNRSDYRVKITTNMRIYWDQILVDTYNERAPIQIHKLNVASAKLGWGGYPREVSPDGKKPMLYDCSSPEQHAPWKSHVGHYTRYGDVTPLLRAKDNLFVVMHHGDEITLDFDARALPSPPRGWDRTFLVYADGFGKDMDLNSAYPDTVDPLPYHGMSGYPFAPPYPEDRARRDYLRKYNTRVIKDVFFGLNIN